MIAIHDLPRDRCAHCDAPALVHLVDTDTGTRIGNGYCRRCALEERRRIEQSRPEPVLRRRPIDDIRMQREGRR